MSKAKEMIGRLEEKEKFINLSKNWFVREEDWEVVLYQLGVPEKEWKGLNLVRVNFSKYIKK